MSKELEEIKELHQQADRAYHNDDFEEMRKFIEVLFLEEYTDWLIDQAEKLEKVKNLVDDENLTKSETVDKISQIVFWDKIMLL